MLIISVNFPGIALRACAYYNIGVRRGRVGWDATFPRVALAFARLTPRLLSACALRRTYPDYAGMRYFTQPLYPHAALSLA